MPNETENVSKKYDLDGGGNIDGGGYKEAEIPKAEDNKTQNEAMVSVEYRRARNRVRRVKAFYVHGLLYAAVNSLLLLIDVLTGSGLWFFWALFGWGIGLAVHAGVVWGAPHVHALEEKMIEQEMARGSR